jgi:hypothetical protein
VEECAGDGGLEGRGGGAQGGILPWIGGCSGGGLRQGDEGGR